MRGRGTAEYRKERRKEKRKENKINGERVNRDKSTKPPAPSRDNDPPCRNLR